MVMWAGSFLGKLERDVPRLILAFVVVAVLWKGGKSLETTWLLTGLAWFASLSVTFRRPNRDVPFWLWAVGITFILWTILSYLQSATANYGLDEVLRDAALVFLSFWAARVAGETPPGGLPFAQRLLTTLAYVTIAACVIGFAVYALQPVSRFVGTFFDLRFHTDYWPNAWAEFLLLGWPAAYFWTARFRWLQTLPAWQGALLRAFLIGLPLAALLLTYSRGALIAFAGQIGLLLLLRLRTGWRPRFGPEQWRAAGCLLVVVLFLFGGANIIRGQFHALESVREKVTFTADEGTSSISERGQFWRQSWRLANEKPLLGWGPGSFRFVQTRLQTDVLATSDHPHNVLLKLLMERGSPALVLFIIFVGAIFGWAFWVHRFPPDPAMAERRAVNGIVITAVAGVLAHNLIDYNLQFVGIALPFWLLLGGLAAALPLPKRSGVPQRFRWRLEVLITTGLLLLAVWEGGFLVTSSLGRHAEANGQVESALRFYTVSQDERFSRDLHLSRAHLYLIIDQPAAAVAALDQYLDQNEEDGRAWKLLGDACLAARDYACALDAYEKAYQLHRYNDLSITLASLNLFQLLGIETDSEQRAEYDALLRAFGEAISVNRHFIALSPNVEAAIALSQKLAELHPAEEPTYILIGAGIERAAAAERAKIQARRPGFLW